VFSAATTSLDEAKKRRSVSGTKHERRLPEDGHIVVTETCRVLIMFHKTFFNNFSVLSVNVCLNRNA
jgi:hypothetical protein